jgi:competence protein ComEC
MLAPQLQEVLQQQHITAHQIDEGWSQIHKSAGQTFSLFAPSQNARDINDRSIVVFAGQRGDGVLLTADLGKAGLQQLFTAGVPERVTLLKLPHHGSRLNQPEFYLDWLKPTAAFVSSGHGNTYGFPHQQVIEACSVRQVPIFRTDQQGMLTFYTDNGRWLSQTGKAL